MFDFCVGRDVTSSGNITTDQSYISYVVIHPSVSGNVIIRDGNETGEIVFKATIGDSNNSKFYPFPYPIKVKNGIYVELNSATITIGIFG